MTDYSLASDPALAGLDPDDYALTFAAVPGRERHDGWTPGRQRRFIIALRGSGAVASAARAVGCTSQSAYRLRRRAGAADFVTAWERALGEARADAFERAFVLANTGYVAPRFYRGRYSGAFHGYDYGPALAILRGAAPRIRAKGEK